MPPLLTDFIEQGTCENANIGTIDVIRNNFIKQHSQKIFSRRKYRAEHPFAHIKKNLGYNVFLLNGNQQVDVEYPWVTSFFKSICLKGHVL